MNKTKNLGLKLLEYNQAQKEIVINEALCLFDSLLNKSVISFVETVPEEKNEGEVYIISADNPKNNTDQEAALAIYLNGWRYIKPKEGWIFWVRSEKKHYVFQNGIWSPTHCNSLVTLNSDNGKISVYLRKSTDYKVHLEQDVTIYFEDILSTNSKISILLIGKSDVKVAWDKEVKWNGVPCLEIKKNSYHLIEIYNVEGALLCKNVAF